MLYSWFPSNYIICICSLRHMPDGGVSELIDYIFILLVQQFLIFFN